MRHNHILLIVFFFIFCTSLFSQETERFYDRSKQLWGFRDATTKQIIIPAQFESAVGWWKEYGIVRIGDKYGLIDREGHKASRFSHDRMNIEFNSETDSIELVAYSIYNRYSGRMPEYRKFYVNKKCDCVPRSFYPCPPTVKMDTSQTSLSLRIVQRAEYWYHQGEVKKALDLVDEAIKTDSTEASVWFWKAIMLSNGWKIPVFDSPADYEKEIKYECDYNKNSIERDKSYLDNRLSGLEKPTITKEDYDVEMKLLNTEDSLLKIHCDQSVFTVDSIEKIYSKWREQSWEFWNANYDTSFHLQNYYDAALRNVSKDSEVYYSILTGKYEISYLSKKDKKKISKEIISGQKYHLRKGTVCIMTTAAFSFFPYKRWEANLTFGLSDYFILKSHFLPSGGIGIGYESSLESNLIGYKLYGFIQPFGIIHYGMSLIYLNGTENSDIGFRPEFGFSYSILSLLYGYNFVSDAKFPGARGNMVSIRINLPVWRQNKFRKDRGNNIYR